MKKTWNTIYLAAVLVICLLPFVGMLWKDNPESSENRKLSELPKLWDEQGWNQELLPELGEYFEEHFAYRQEFVTADAMVRSKVFGVSAADGVIDGTEGWLYYKDSLKDYLGYEVLSDRAVFNVAHTLKMIQDYVEEKGNQFLFTVAPNKNSLYGDHMPYYDQIRSDGERNIDKLRAALTKEEVHYLDLYPLFENSEEILYHKTDSHWNNKGAAMASETLMDTLGKTHRTYMNADYEIKQDFEGDLEKMLFPAKITQEEEIYYTEGFSYQYVEPVESNFDPDIKTTGQGKEGSLLMYRDSFGNALLPFLAEEYGNARFTRGVPYYLDDMIFCGADTVLIERAERFIPDMAENPPVFQSPEYGELLQKAIQADKLGVQEESGLSQQKESDLSQQKEFDLCQREESVSSRQKREDAASCEVSDEGLFVKISGVIDERFIDTETKIYLSIDGEAMYEAFPNSVSNEERTTDCGYTAYIGKERIEDEEFGVKLYVEQDGQLQIILESEQMLEMEIW